MSQLKSLLWFLIALFSLNFITMAKIGKKVKAYMGFASSETIAHSKTDTLQRTNEEVDSKLWFASKKQQIRGP